MLGKVRSKSESRRDGTGSQTPEWQRPPAKATGMRLMGFPAVASGILHPGDGQGDRYRSEARQIYSLESDGNLNTGFQAPQWFRHLALLSPHVPGERSGGHRNGMDGQRS